MNHHMHPRLRAAREGGSALVLALIAAFLLLIVSFEVAHTTRIETFITANIEDDTKLEVGCRSGLEKALAILREDRQQTEIDSQQEAWWTLTSETLTEEDVASDEFLYDDPYRSLSADSETERATNLLIEIFDESAKWNLYLLNVEDDLKKRERIDSLANVIDRFREETDGDVTFGDAREMAAEIAAYVGRSEDRPYRDTLLPPVKKPGTLLDLSELLYVEGVTPDVLWDRLSDDGERVIPGLYRFVTIWSDLQININTAEHAALAGVFDPKDVHLAERILEHRDEVSEERERESSFQRSRREREESERSGDTGVDPTGGAPFTQISDLNEKVDGMTQEVYNKISSYVTVQSSVFSVFVTAERGEHGLFRRTKCWVVRRSEMGFQILQEKLVDFPYLVDPERRESAEEEAAEQF